MGPTTPPRVPERGGKLKKGKFKKVSATGRKTVQVPTSSTPNSEQEGNLSKFNTEQNNQRLPPATTVQGARGARTNQWVDGFAHGVQRTTLFKCFGDFFDRQPKKQCHQYIIDQKIQSDVVAMKGQS
jgi:hypothetical protein